MVVSNDFYRAAVRRSTVLTNVVEPEKLLDRCFYDLLRGPSLGDSASPLRGHSILADQYGYGFKCAVFNDGASTPTTGIVESGPFVRFHVNASPTLPGPVLGITRLLQPEPTAAYIDLEAPAALYVDGIYGGRVLTVLSGALKGHSTRIIYNEFITNTPGTSAADVADNRLTFTLPDDGLDWTLLQDGDLILVNGRDFSGLGCGETTALLASTVNPDAESDLGAKATRPNRVGDLFDPAVLAASTTPGLVKLNATTTGYLASDGAPNEPWDAPDYQNMFLSGPVGAAGFIPSFHRDTLYTDQVTPLTATQLEQIRQFSFRPFHIATAGGPADYSTASAGSPFDGSWYDRTTGLIPAGSGNMTTQLDVDSDNDGVLDAVWIDIGLPDQIDSDGNTFRPLVAYRVTDLDGRLNVNAHGSYADEEIQDAIRNRSKPVTSRGAGYGVSEVTLEGLFPAAAGIFANYRTLLNSRYTDPRGGSSTPDALPGSEAPSTSFDTLNSNQKQFGYPIGANGAVTGGLFRTPGDLFAQFEIETGGMFASTNMTLPELPTPVAPTTPAAAVEFFTAPADISSPYQTSFSISGSTGDNLFAANELEVLLRPFDVDSVDLPTRLSALLQPLEQNATTHSFEVSVPATPFSLADLLASLVGGTSGNPLATKNMIAAGVLPRDAVLGKKLDINRPLGDGVDNDGDGVVDNNPETLARSSAQVGGPNFDLDNVGDVQIGDSTAKQLLAKDLYITAMLSCSNLTAGGTTLEPATLVVSNGTSAAAYAQMIAQWAVNIVDFRDPDSIMTKFDYDPTPFDGWAPTATVFGAERPELLINETFAYHDRATEDRAVDDNDQGRNPNKVSDMDRHWDNAQIPRSGAFFELYHPWVQDSSVGGITTHELVPQDFGTTGVNLGQATAMGDPVWRMAFRRDKTDAMFNRAVYFTDASAVRATINADISGDYFFTSLGSKTVLPGEYAVIGSSGNAGVDSGNYRTTFGRLQRSAAVAAVTEADITETRGIRLNPTTDVVTRIDGAGAATTTSAKVIVIDQANSGARSLSISDPNGGYALPVPPDPAVAMDALDGTYLTIARDVPYDAAPVAYRDGGDIQAILNNGTDDNFRFAYLQRLANPLVDFDPVSNPYITIDVAGVDLLSFNGMTFNQNNGMTAEPGSMDEATDFRSAERGESFGSVMLARQNFFTSDDGMAIAEDPAASPVPAAEEPLPHNFSYKFEETFGAQNVSHIDATFTPISWLTWNDRPFANAAELANVPFLSAEGLTYNFNMGSTSVTPQSIAMVTELETMAYFGRADDNFRHLMRLGQDNGISAGTAGGAIPSNAALTAVTAPTNRMINFLEYVEVPSRFLGSETFLYVDGAGTVVDGNEAGLLGATPRFQPPFHSIPNFRTPGKVNLNTVPSAIVWNSLFSGTMAPAFATFETNRDTASGPTDFAGFYSSPMAGEFVVPGQALPTTGKGADKTIFRNTTPAVSGGIYDVTSASPRDSVGSAYFRNELQQKLGNVATTRSSVFAIWITVGYFNVDQFGRLGAEVGSDAGEVARNRAFYMIDRSIPVAFEPGNDHNVDDVVLIKTIID